LQDALPAMASDTCVDVFCDPASRFFFCHKQRKKQKVKLQTTQRRKKMNKDLFDATAGAEFVQPESAITAKTPITWTVVENLNELPEKDDAFLGRVYSIEFDDGSVKIGSSSQCKNRISCIVTCSGLYGFNRAVRFAYSSPHVEYYKNEKMLHRTFAEQHFAGRNREIFRVKIEDV
jgi:hypothetical protein